MTIPEVVITSASINNHKRSGTGELFLQCNMYDNIGIAAALRLRLRLASKRRLS
jgi:hypothetical protein